MTGLGIIYAACVAGAIGVLLLLPRPRNRLGPIGAVLAAGALGAGMLALTRLPGMRPGEGPDLFFYILAFLSAFGALRVITHPQPLYSALYFVLVILSSAGLLLLAGAEFVAFALVIVYAGAILVTYLFVIMLAQQATGEGDLGGAAEYDLRAREPIAATMACFLLLAALLGVMYRGTQPDVLTPGMGARIVPDREFAVLTRPVAEALRKEGLMQPGERLMSVQLAERTAVVGFGEVDARVVDLPTWLRVENVDAVGVSLLAEFPVSLEVAGVILMLAMLGAVVMARRPADGGWRMADGRWGTRKPQAPSPKPQPEGTA